MVNKNYFEIKGNDKNPVILSKVDKKYRVSYFEDDKPEYKDFGDKAHAEIFARSKYN